jgi:hypothetical protein
MTTSLLQQIVTSRLPMTIYRNEELDQLRILRAAGLVVAALPDPADSPVRSVKVSQRRC